MSLSSRLSHTQDSEPAIALSAEQQKALVRVRARLSKGTWRTEPIPCICGIDGDQVELASRDAYGLPFGATLCGGCGLVRTSPGLSKEGFDALMAEEHEALCIGDVDRGQVFDIQASQGTQLLVDLASLGLSPESVIDLGCGSGGTLLPFAKTGARVAGCDRTGSFLEEGNRRGLELVRGNADTLLNGSVEPADLVLLMHEVEHFRDLREELTRALRAVRPGGHLLVQVHGLRAIPHCHDGDLLAYLQDTRSWHFSAATLAYVLTSVGLEIRHLDEQCMALARLPKGPPAPALGPQPAEALDVLRYVGALEKDLLEARSDDATPRVEATPDRQKGKPAEKPSPDTPVFFCIGCQKSGTTLLARVLDQHPSIACMSESYALQPLTPASILNPSSDKWRTHGFAEEDVARWASVMQAELQHPKLRELMQLTGRQYPLLSGFARAMPEALSDFAQRTGAHVVGDKWPWYIDYLDVVLEAFPQARFIYNVRDPRGLWNSGQRFKERKRGDRILGEMLHKDQQVSRFLASDRFMTVRYEDLVCSPEQTARDLYGFLGVAYDKSFLSYDPKADPYPERWSWVKEAKDPFDAQHTRKWREQMSAEQIERVSAQAGSFLDKYEYAA